MKKLRQEFADTMLEVGQKDEKLVVMVGDISHGILQPYATACPNRYYNVGICEPTIVNMAAGLAKSGLIPVVHTIAPFIIERAYEQIKLDFGYQKLGINLISVGSAFDYSQLGCSHHCYADLALMSHFKEAQVFHPGSALEFHELFKATYKSGKINYFRLTEYPHGVIFIEDQIQVGKGILVRKGSDFTVVTMGSQLQNAMEAARLLEIEGIDLEILYYPTLQPFDEALVQASVAKTRHVLALEEASRYGGLFERVLRATTPLEGVHSEQMAIDDFIHFYGSYQELCEAVGLTAHDLVKRVQMRCSLAS